MDFFGILLTVLVLTYIFKQPTKSPEKFNTFVPKFGYADKQYGSDFSFSPEPSVSLSDINAKLAAESEYTSSYEEYYETDVENQLDPTVIVTKEMQYVYQDDEDVAVTTQQVELAATPTVQVDVNTTVVNDTSVTQVGKIPTSAATTMLKLATVMISVVSAALFITVMLIIWNNRFIFSSIKYKIMDEDNSNDAELGDTKHRGKLTI